MWFYILAATLFVLSQLDYFLLNKVCEISQVLRYGDSLDVLPGDLQGLKC